MVKLVHKVKTFSFYVKAILLCRSDVDKSLDGSALFNFHHVVEVEEIE